MKIVIAALIALTAQASLADCLGEAQIIATVAKVSQTMAHACTVHVENVTVYNDNMTCPLSLMAVDVAGVQIGTNAEGSCLLNAGDVLTGVLVLKNDGTIVLE